MYWTHFNGGGLPADSGGVVGGGAQVGAEACVSPCPGSRKQQRNPRRREEEREAQDQWQLPAEEDHGPQIHRQEQPVDMVAQEMAQGYTQLLRGGQEPQEFISLEELKPRLQDQDHHGYSQTHNEVQTVPASPNAALYHHSGQQRSYYNLTPVPKSSCSLVYFDRIDAGVEDLAVPAGGVGPGGGGVPNSQGPTGAESGPQREAEQGGAATASHHYRQASHHHHHHHHHHHQQSQSQSPNHYNPGHCTPLHVQPFESPSSVDTGFAPSIRKRKISWNESNELQNYTGDDTKSVRTNDDSKSEGSELQNDTGDDAKTVRTNDDSKRQNHSEIEKRRRDKMNTYITELSAMVPMCHAMSRKLDKLTILRMAVQHLKTILGAATPYTEGHYKPAFLSDQELKMLILQAAEGFVFVVGCDRGRILYVSQSVSQTLNYSQGDLLGQNWFDILHPKDVAKVKEQLSSSDLSPRERLIDVKTMLPVKTDVPHDMSRFCPGARRSFFCRMKRKLDNMRCGNPKVKEEADTTTGCHRRKKQQNNDCKYCVIQCTGYLKAWAPAKIGLEEQEGEDDGEACNLSCLVAVGRVQPQLPAFSAPRRPHLRTIQFISRHAMDGKFLSVDQRATLVLGFLPQELLGTNMYEYYHHDDIPHLAESHKAALQAREQITTQVYRFRSKEATFVRMQSEFKSFRNPWTKDVESLIAKNSAIFSDVRRVESSATKSEDSNLQGNYDYLAQSNYHLKSTASSGNGGLERLIRSHIEVSKIGRQIAEEVLDSQRKGEDSSPDPGSEPASRNTESQISTTVSPEGVMDISVPGVGSDNSNSDLTPSFTEIRNNVQLSSISNDQGVSPDESMMEMIGDSIIDESPNPIPTDGNDEAAMAVIMSLLEADAGLGGPVDFSGLPWPLP
ncbi:aryl hydrocarbon receptor nuclear translocator-like protein 1 isoform X2 [Diprion similis]|uniref:aryl hydrocarbon receptor nuclear translocator-like protein 1 isoform X2 n=1 Tax=Diprion similis TaxID=362088 RepID=UPI001EF9B649|nr:aryl hydrocarbon receptor nuclear translocator-like protein 1 isoform X2 [Diprion similis]